MMIALWVCGGIAAMFGLMAFFGAPYVPSHKRQVARALKELYPLGEADVLVDVGSGDGVVLRIASQCGARAVGYELNPFLAGISRLLSWHDARVYVRIVNFWMTPLPDDTTVVYAFSVERDMKRMSRKINAEANRLGRTLYYISYANEIPGASLQRKVGAHRLYAFHALQGEKAQV